MDNLQKKINKVKGLKIFLFNKNEILEKKY